MKLELISLFVPLSFFMSCRDKQEWHTFIPKEYEFPSVLIDKTLVYVDSLHGDTSFYDIFYSKKGCNNYLVSKAYSKSGTSDSVVYLNGKMIENYTRKPNSLRLVKGEIITNKISGDFHKGKQITEVIFDFDSTVFFVRSESQFVQDTTTYYNQHDIPTIQITTSLKGNIKSKLIPSIDTTFNGDFFTYYAKGIGVVKIRVPKTADNKTNIVKLVQIKDRH